MRLLCSDIQADSAELCNHVDHHLLQKPSILQPDPRASHLVRRPRNTTSVTRMKSKGDSGAPCITPRCRGTSGADTCPSDMTIALCSRMAHRTATHWSDAPWSFKARTMA
eukprot:3470710-Alexandrium_andersonii.AAC.1